MQKHFATAEIKLAENSANVDFRFLQGTELLIRSSLWRVFGVELAMDTAIHHHRYAICLC